MQTLLLLLLSHVFSMLALSSRRKNLCRKRPRCAVRLDCVEAWVPDKWPQQLWRQVLKRPRRLPLPPSDILEALTCHTFLSDATVNHSAVASFAGSTSRATHKGTFTALVQYTNNKLHRLVQKESALVVPDASRTLFSISQALLAGHHVHFGNSPGLLLHIHSTKIFIPFVRDSHTGMYLLPLIPPASRHNGTYSLQQAMRAAIPAIPIPHPSCILPAIPITKYTPSDITLHNTLSHIAHRRSQQLDVGIPQPSGKKVTCPICITAKARRTACPLPSDVAKHAQHPWQDFSVDLSGKMRIQGISNVYYYIPFVCNFSVAKMVEFVQRKSRFVHPL